MSLRSEYGNRGWLERCQRCGKRVPRSLLLRQLTRLKLGEGHNYFPYSDYNSTGWTASGCSDVGTLSRSDTSFYNEIEAGTISGTGPQDVTTPRGTQTWGGDGSLTSDAFDLSAWTRFLVALRVGSPEQYPDYYTPTLTVTVTVTDGVTSQVVRSVTAKGTTQVVASMAVVDLPAALDNTSVQFVISVATPNGTDYWFASMMQLKKDISSLPRRGAVWIKTCGAQVVRDTDSDEIVAMVVCRECEDKKPDEINEWTPTPDEYPDIAEDLTLA